MGGEIGMKIKIGNKLIGEEEPCFIIAEAGVNHNGSVEMAKKLIDAAKDAGADAVKFQTFKAEGVVTKDAEMDTYQKENIGKEMTQLEMLKELELSYDNFKELKKYCDKRGIVFLSTPHSEDAIDFLEPLVPAYKIESGDITNHPRLEKIAGKGKPIILSTGMSTLDEAKEALQVIKNQGNSQIIILHCTSNYPCPLDEVNLRAMQTMEKELNCLVGYSDHTLRITVPIAAVALGAVAIEKHFTLDKNMPGPDHKASLEPSELRDMVYSIRNVEEQLKKGEKAEGILKKIPNIEKILGDGIKKPTQSEEEIKKTSRKGIVARVDISKESIITADMLTIKRLGVGIEPKNKNINKLIGKKAKMDIAKDTVLSWNMFR